ncbi:MATE family efflux transporter [Halocynthiibacter namhaensis]|uniref:MATE family efflux transporter n=1 Tax=Halocynthiibacter namhaensis TaxID=1290553 RepID=UPI0005794B65|nr:MATE family efflux transporter [Halocynthiibacter namhaensis]
MNTASAPQAEITHKRILAIAGPIVLSNATVPILGLVDTGVVGQMGLAAPIGAVGIGAVILSAIYWIFGFLRMGTTGLAAQARGAGDLKEGGALLMRGLMIGGAAGLVFILTQWFLFAGAFYWSPASDEVETLARQYMTIRIWGAPATIALFAITGWLIAMEKTKGVLILQLWMNSLNIGLDLLFVLELGWGVEGVAIATLIAEWTGLLLGLYLCRSAFSGNQWRDWPRIFDRVRLKNMMLVNADIMVRSVLLTFSFVSFLMLGSNFGDVTLAANQVLLQFVEITAYALDGFAFSAEALVGSAVGAGNRRDLRRASVMSSQWGLIGSVVLAAVFWFAGPMIIDVMATSHEVQAAGREYLLWVAALPVISVASYMFDGIFIGAIWTREMRNAMLVSVAVYIVALASLMPLMGNHGLWMALVVLNVARGVTLGWYYPRLEARVGPA